MSIRLRASCLLISLVMLSHGGRVRADPPPDPIEQAIATCDRPQILFFLQMVTDPLLQQRLLGAWQGCWEAEVERLCDEGDLDALIAAGGAIVGDPYLSPEAKAALIARLDACTLEAIRVGLPEAERDCDLERLEAMAGYALALGDSELFGEAQEAWVDCLFEAIRRARRDCDLDALYDAFERSLSDLFPFERHGKLQDAFQAALLHCLDKALDALRHDLDAPDWIDRWVDLYEVLIGDLVSGKRAEKVEGHAFDVLAKWYERRIDLAAAEPCDPDALDALADEIEGGLLPDKQIQALLGRIAKARRKC